MSLVKESVNLRSLKFLFEAGSEEEDNDLPTGLDELSDKILKDFGSLRQFFVKTDMKDVALFIGAAAKEFKSKVDNEDDKRVVSAQIAGQMFIAAFSNLIVNLNDSFKRSDIESDEMTLSQIFDRSVGSSPDDLEKYFEKYFIPSPKARKAHLNSWRQLKESLGNNQSVINEGPIDWIKSFFGTSGPKTASQLIAIVKRVLPQASRSLQKFIGEFKTDARVTQQTTYKQFRDGAKTFSTFLKQQVVPTDETPSNNNADETPSRSVDGDEPSGASDGGDAGGERSDEEPTEPIRPPSRRSEPNASPSPAKNSIKSLLNLEDVGKAKAVLDRVKDAKISVTGIDNHLNGEQKQKLANALDKIEGEMKKKIEDSFTESRKKESDSLIIERWQHLAGIIK
jgi:hypothetical protein